MSITDYDLKCAKYDVAILEKNIDSLSQWALIKYQDLTAEFCAKYILDEQYASCEEDTYICLDDIVWFQSHIKKEDIVNEYNKIHNKTET
jgi:hypothetical protein